MKGVAEKQVSVFGDFGRGHSGMFVLEEDCSAINKVAAAFFFISKEMIKKHLSIFPFLKTAWAGDRFSVS